MSKRRSGNDCLGFLLGEHWSELYYASRHLNDIPDEGEALTSNPLVKRQSSKKKHLKTNRATLGSFGSFRYSKKKKKKRLKKHRLYHNSCVCRFSHYLLSFLCDLVVERWDLLCALLHIFKYCCSIFDIEGTPLQIKFSATISFFCTFNPRFFLLSQRSGLCCNQSQELWGLQGLVFQNVLFILGYLK